MAGRAVGDSLTWPDAMREAHDRNPALLAARADTESAARGVTVATAGFWPSLAAQAGLDRSGSSRLDDAWHPVGRSALATQSSFGGLASWTVFAGGETRAARTRALAALAGRRAAERTASQSLRAQLRKAFDRLLFAQRNLDLLASIKDRLHRDTRYLEIQFTAGREARWTFLKAQATEAAVDWQVGQARTDLEGTRDELARLLGRDPDGATPLTASGELDRPAPPAAVRPLYAIMEQRHPGLAAQAAAVAGNEAALTAAQASRWPQVGLHAGQTWSDGGSWPPEAVSRHAGVSVSLPLFSGGADEAGIARARRDLEAAERTGENVRATLRSALFSAWAAARSAWEHLPALALDLESSVERFKTVQALYESGKAAYLDFEQAEAALTSAQQRQLSGRLELATASAEFDRALGLTLDDAAGDVP